ncbi:MAG TPA: NADH-ubiquinone oxidoreductase-F iron-sulfur binding region domain-containing protein [Pseudonocardiaceae bacterium]|nr:NADH-ubiquinone oxidoreductase-F iron-sulfur binding region domain-containing protein [Pseudonocardiaceae bacterium]
MTTMTYAPGPLLSSVTPDLADHVRRTGGLPWQGPGGRLIGLLEQAGLTGRGGAGFPTWRKLAAVAVGARPVVIGNGAEGEPASAKDGTLLTRSPHLVLDGLQLAAEAVGAADCYLYVSGRVVEHVRHAAAERAGRDRFAVTVVVAPDRFVAGEESAAIAAIAGRKALPTDKAQLVVQSGLRGRPTLVQNVETLAHIAVIAQCGAAAFRRSGTGAEPGSFLATLGGAVPAPGVYEAPYGIRIGKLLALAGGPAVPLSAVLVGGYHGAWLPIADALAAPMSRAGLAPFGATPGAGIVRALPVSHCGLAETARITDYLAAQSAKQCGPCRNGLPLMAQTLHRLAVGDRDRGLPEHVARLSALVVNRGACHHPDGTVRLVSSAMRVFAVEVDLHLAGRCSAAEGTR